MDKMMDSPWFLRITALLLALLLFFTVQAENDTTTSTDGATSSERIEDLELDVFYDNTNLMVSGLPDTADLTITGPTSVVQTTRQLQDFSLFVDLRNLELGEHRVPIQTENLSEQLRATVQPAYINVTIEERVTEEFRIDPEMNERLLAEGYELESITSEPNTVMVTGPKSVIDSISFVKATVSGEQDIAESFKAEARVRVLANDLTKLENVTIEPEVVEVQVNIEEYSQEVPVSIEQTGTPPEGVTINSLMPSNETVRIYGPRNVINQLTEFVVEFDAAAIVPVDPTIEIALVTPAGATGISPESLTVEAGII
ncbi:MAG TPA: CdaR family protein, partial [Planococcus sp. (in: firmicutes)]|nr:CdaR family protein [Planococcus sp. (in: firmicutes)]